MLGITDRLPARTSMTARAASLGPLTLRPNPLIKVESERLIRNNFSMSDLFQLDGTPQYSRSISILTSQCVIPIGQGDNSGFYTVTNNQCHSVQDTDDTGPYHYQRRREPCVGHADRRRRRRLVSHRSTEWTSGYGTSRFLWE